MWRYLTTAQKEALTINIVGAFLGFASWASPVPFVFPLVSFAFTGYALYLYRKIDKEGS